MANAVAISAGRSGRTRCPHAVPEGGVGAEERRFVGTTTLKPASAVGRVLAGQAPTARGREPAIEPIPCRCAGICSHPLHHPAEQAGLPLHPSAPRPLTAHAASASAALPIPWTYHLGWYTYHKDNSPQGCAPCSSARRDHEFRRLRHGKYPAFAVKWPCSTE